METNNENPITLAETYLNRLKGNSLASLNEKQLEQQNSLKRLNFISIIDEIKTNDFAPALLQEFSKTKNNLSTLDDKIKLTESIMLDLETEILSCGEQDTLTLLISKKDSFNNELRSLKGERERLQKYILEVLDQFAFKETFKEKNKKKDEDPNNMYKIMSAIAGATAGATAGAMQKKQAQSNKPKSRKLNNKIIDIYKN